MVAWKTSAAWTAVGNPLLYGTTPDFLQVFGLKDLNSLPTLKEFQELNDEMRAMLPEEDTEAALDADLGQERDPEDGLDSLAEPAVESLAEPSSS